MYILLFLLPACPTPEDPPTCEQQLEDLQAEAVAIRSCEVATDCGQVLHGTSCGCTRDWVARNDADPTSFDRLLAEMNASSCETGLGSTCDCPEAYGFACEAGECTWNYADSSAGLPDCRTEDGDPFEVAAATVAGDTLTVSVSYGGGCEAHDFALCWPDGTFMESAPVQVDLDLWHDGHDDPCDAYLSEDRALDLTPLKLAWQVAYHATSGTIVIHVNDQTVSYSF